MSKMIPYGKQNINQDDIDSVVKVLSSDWLTQGPQVPLFEEAVAKKCHAKYAVAVNSATSALHIANLALNIAKGDIVWTTPITFVATANSVLYCQAQVDFVDIDLSTGNMCAQALSKKLIKAKELNALPKAIIVVHMAGQSCLMEEIYALSKRYNFYIIEDASHAIGGQYHNKPIGKCEFSDICIFSFHPVKIITSAEGGMALTNNTEFAKKMRLFRSHGITSQQDEMTEQSHGPWYYQQIELGFNYRMTDIQAALGLSQLNRIDEFVQQRNKLASIYDEAFSSTKITPLKPNEHCVSSYHLYLILLPETLINKHQAIVIALRQKNICAHVHYIPVHLQPYYQKLGFNQGDFPQAEKYYQQVLTLPLHPLLTQEEQRYIIEQVKEIAR